MDRIRLMVWMGASCAGLLGCGEVVDPGAVDAAEPPDGAAAVCAPGLAISSTFTVDAVGGDGTSPLDVMLNHLEGLVLTFDDHAIARGLDANHQVLTTAIRSAAWSPDFTGHDGDLLDDQLGSFLTHGQLYQQALVTLADDHVELFVLPDDYMAHPYVGISCNAPLPTDDNGFPILESRTFTGCTVTIWDGRAGAFRYLFANGNATFEIAYQACP